MTKSERSVYLKLVADKWKVLHLGWPDFMCIRQERNKVEVMTVEVKCGKDHLSNDQARMHQALKLAGINAEVRHVKAPAPPRRCRVLHLSIPKKQIDRIHDYAIKHGRSLHAEVLVLLEEQLGFRPVEH
jgi:hypothetical protein